MPSAVPLFHRTHLHRSFGAAPILGLLLALPAATPAATLQVAPGATAIAQDGQCSLAEAIQNANADAQVGNTDCVAGSGVDVLQLAADADYVLAVALPAIASSIFLEGNGSTIERSSALPCSLDRSLQPGEFRLLTLDSGELALRDLTLRNGCADGPISAASRRGGAAYAAGGSLLLERVSMEMNQAEGFGGGLSATNATVRVVDSLFQENQSNDGGGGMASLSGAVMTLERSTLSANVAAGSGGGGALNFGSLTMVNSTVSGNLAMPTAEFSGGGGISSSAPLTLVNTTVFGNALGGAGAFGGAGLLGGGMTLVRNSLIVENIGGEDCLNGFGSFQSEGENLDTDGSCVALDADNFTQVTSQALALGPLQNNGGPTPTHLPGPASVARDAVPVCTYLAAPLTVDQRGVARPQFGACDLGSVEAAPLTPAIFADGFE
jgi:hypothetical protein